MRKVIEVKTKSIWQSKTFYVAALQALIAVVGVVMFNFPETVGALLIFKSLLDIGLRFVSVLPIKA